MKTADQGQFVARGQAVGGRGVVVGGGEVAERAAGLDADQVAEDLVGRQAVALARAMQLGAGRVPSPARARARRSLHPEAVEREREQRGILASRADDRFGLGAASVRRGAGRATRARSSRAAAPVRRRPAARRLSAASRRRDDPRGLRRIVDRVQIAGTS